MAEFDKTNELLSLINKAKNVPQRAIDKTGRRLTAPAFAFV